MTKIIVILGEFAILSDRINNKIKIDNEPRID